MTAPAIAPSNRALTSNAGNAKLYAEQLLARICRRWGVPVHEIAGNRYTGMRTENVVTKAVIAEFLVEVMPMRIRNGWNGKAAMVSERRQMLSHEELGALLGISGRTVRRNINTIEAYRVQAHGQQDPGAAATYRSQKGQVAELSSPLDVTPSRLTGYDRASMEELIAGGGQ